MAISSSTFSSSNLSKIMRGIAKTRIVPVTSGSVTFSATTFASAGEFYSIEGSMEIDWPEPDITEVKVDQGQKSIAMDIENGEITFSANYPSVAASALSELFKVAGSTSTVKSPDDVTYTGPGLFVEPKTTEVSILIEDMDEKFAIAMARVSLTCRLAYDSDSKIWYIGCNGRVLANLASGQPDVVVGEKVVNG